MCDFLQAYNMNNAYIATQGPKPNTVNDFWRMIWQENVKYIVIVANVEENGKVKKICFVSIRHIKLKLYFKVFINIIC